MLYVALTICQLTIINLTVDINAEALKESIRGDLKIYPYPIAYHDNNQKKNYLNGLAKGINEYNEYKNCGSATDAAVAYLATAGTLFIFTINMIPAAPTQQEELEQAGTHPDDENVSN
jgi:hypothetical protein